VEPKARFELLRGEKSEPTLGSASIGKSRRLHDASGFTLLEIVMVLFLLTGMLSLVIPQSIDRTKSRQCRKKMGRIFENASRLVDDDAKDGSIVRRHRSRDVLANGA
jgi:competence protein ComGF